MNSYSVTANLLKQSLTNEHGDINMVFFTEMIQFLALEEGKRLQDFYKNNHNRNPIKPGASELEIELTKYEIIFFWH